MPPSPAPTPMQTVTPTRMNIGVFERVPDGPTEICSLSLTMVVSGSHRGSGRSIRPTSFRTIKLKTSGKETGTNVTSKPIQGNKSLHGDVLLRCSIVFPHWKETTHQSADCRFAHTTSLACLSPVMAAARGPAGMLRT